MYTVLVADDEQGLREAIVKKVDWNSIGFEIVGQAENGVEALELAEKLEPDLLLTDIKMPFISGIELARQVREIRPSMHIAFLSGHDDFIYAQQAIQYNIISYLLKPISLEELTKELVKIKNKMDSINAELRSNTAGLGGGENLLQIKAENFLMPLILDNSGISAHKMNENSLKLIEEEAAQIGLKKDIDDSPVYVVLVYKFKDADGNNCTNENYVSPINAVLKKYVRSVSFYSNEKVVSVIAENESELHEYLHIIVDEIIQIADRVLGVKCYIGVSREMSMLSTCSAAYNEALTAIGYSQDGESRVRYISDVEQRGKIEYTYISESVSRLESLLKVGEASELLDYISQFFSELKYTDASKADIDLLLMQMISVVCTAVNSVSGGESAESFLSKSPILTNFFIYRSMEEVEKEFINFCVFAKETIQKERKMNTEILCDKALEIIGTDYADVSLSLVSLSERLHVSPNYLSALIKKVKGDTFINILTDKRMSVAKDYVLCSSLRVIEITFKCGYNDQHYFSYCFKRKFGLSPNKMREMANQP